MEEKKTKCCKAPAEWAYKEKGIVVSNTPFLVCSKCKKGNLWRLEGIKI